VNITQLLCEQLSLADVTLVSKLDTLSKEEQSAALALISEVNPTCRVIHCHHGEVDLDLVLGIKTFSVENVLSLEDWNVTLTLTFTLTLTLILIGGLEQ